MRVVLLFPSDGRKETKTDVQETDTAFGDENSVYLKYNDGSEETLTAVGLTIVAAQEN